MTGERAYFAEQQSLFHAGQPPEGGKSVSEAGVASNADMTGERSVEQAYFAQQRSLFHAGLLAEGILSVSAGGVASNADSGSALSRALAGHIATSLKVETANERLAGQTSGGQFEEACANFLNATFG